jgi:hypothetical protein
MAFLPKFAPLEQICPAGMASKRNAKRLALSLVFLGEERVTGGL